MEDKRKGGNAARGDDWLNDVSGFEERKLPLSFAPEKKVIVMEKGDEGTKQLSLSYFCSCLLCVCVSAHYSREVFARYPRGNMVGDHPCPMELLVGCQVWARRFGETL